MRDIKNLINQISEDAYNKISSRHTQAKIIQFIPIVILVMVPGYMFGDHFWRIMTSVLSTICLILWIVEISSYINFKNQSVTKIMDKFETIIFILMVAAWIGFPLYALFLKINGHR